jgi:uncharacterized protein YjeT (DUF2065 family)
MQITEKAKTQLKILSLAVIIIGALIALGTYIWYMSISCPVAGGPTSPVCWPTLAALVSQLIDAGLILMAVGFTVLFVLYFVRPSVGTHVHGK